MKPPKISMKQARIHGTNLLFLLPAFALFAFVVILPFLQGIPYSFTNWKSVISTNYDYVGFSNYITLIRNRYFQQAFLHTFQFTAIYVTGANVLGLGLALCKSIITAHGGTITVRDNEPRGTIFQFTLPSEEAMLHE